MNIDEAIERLKFLAAGEVIGWTIEADAIGVVVAELVRVRGERDRAAQMAYNLSPLDPQAVEVFDRPAGRQKVIAILASGPIPGDELAAALAEHDRQANEKAM